MVLWNHSSLDSGSHNWCGGFNLLRSCQGKWFNLCTITQVPKVVFLACHFTCHFICNSNIVWLWLAIEEIDDFSLIVLIWKQEKFKNIKIHNRCNLTFPPTSACLSKIMISEWGTLLVKVSYYSICHYSNNWLSLFYTISLVCVCLCVVWGPDLEVLRAQY